MKALRDYSHQQQSLILIRIERNTENIQESLFIIQVHIEEEEKKLTRKIMSKRIQSVQYHLIDYQKRNQGK